MIRHLMLLATLACACSATGQDLSDSADINATIDLQHPPPTCSISASSGYFFGTVERPAPGGYGFVGGSGDEEFSLSGEHVASWVVPWTLPTNLTNSGGSTIPVTVVRDCP